MIQLDRLDPQPAGFGQCGKCTYRDVGTAAICFACASAATEAPADDRCRVCDQHTDASGRCPNYWCRRPLEERHFEVVWAIAMRTGALEQAINSYKFRDRTGWAVIFGRILVGYLAELAPIFDTYDVIAPMPTYVGPGSRRTWDHIGLIVEKAAIEAAGRWPFHVTSPPIIRKTADTQSMTSLGMYDRRLKAETEIRGALEVANPDLVVGKTVLIFDDVFTEGSTLREVARALTLAGATSVGEVVLARQPW